MKRTILLVLMAALIATPCLAQEVEIDGMFSIEETKWRVCWILITSVFPPFIFMGCEMEFGFYQGTAYRITKEGECSLYNFSYIDSPVVSTAYTIDFTDGLFIELAIMQPIGFGVYTLLAYGTSSYSPSRVFGVAIGTMFKIDDNWTPEKCLPVNE